MNHSEQLNDLAKALVAAQGSGDWEAEGRLIPRVKQVLHPKPKYYTVESTPFRRLMMKVGFGMSDCWYWTANIDDLGYGRIGKIMGETRAHRLSYRIFKGDIPVSMKVMHGCDVRNCVNPDHLSLGTQADNVADMMQKGRWATGDHTGERNGQSKLTREKVTAIRALVADGMSQHEASRRFKVAPMTINRAVRMETWK